MFFIIFNVRIEISQHYTHKSRYSLVSLWGGGCTFSLKVQVMKMIATQSPEKTNSRQRLIICRTLLEGNWIKEENINFKDVN